ncbi:S24 family peptidase [Lysinibacillus sp. 38-6]|uniref:S24 family peptidase n=1 Tax=Lysinibacillus sp. 38-6 TaxID=3385991 RepID=UPI003908A1DC
MVDISRVLKDIVAKSGLEQEKFGETLGLKKAAFNNYVQGRRELPKSVITKMMEVHNINPSVFFDKDAPLYIRDVTNTNLNNLPPNITPINSGLVRIPVIGEIACGEPILASQNIEEFIYEPADTLPNGEIFALKAKGDSMEPTIPNGAIVLIREQNEVAYGEIAAVLVNGDLEATLKRIKKQGDTVFLMSDNPKYEPYIIDEQNPARIIGKAISFKVTL